MAPIDYSRFDNIDTSSDTDDDAEDANIEELLAQVEDGFSPEDVASMASIIDSAVLRTFGGDVDIMTDVLPPLHIRAGDSMFDGIAARIREYEDARPQRRRVALVANDVNDRFFPPILPKKKSKSHATPPGKQKQKQKKPRLPCVGCGAPARKKCSGCHKLGVDTRYCAAQCQRDHWPKHKRECGTKHPEIVAKTSSPIPGLPRDVVLTHILASPTCVADPGDLARLSAVSRAMRHAVRETKRPVYELSCVYLFILIVLSHLYGQFN
ncbi:zinc finger MYND domain-containing protein [Candidatus Dependentiae bacterium]|nr:zinc finger MYND domain-containing protein [Candidatus Dependentiae bacterium]